MPNVELDDLILEQLEEQFDETCDYPECEGIRTHLLTCPLCPASENMCEPHAVAAKNAGPEETVVFDRSCRHRARFVDCGKVRIR